MVAQAFVNFAGICLFISFNLNETDGTLPWQEFDRSSHSIKR